MVKRSRESASDAMVNRLTPRARQKLATRGRVRDAAFELFVRHGFERTTTKAVAERAGVAAGTVFVHARDKQDLLMLVMHDRIVATVDAAFATLPKRGSLIDRLLHVFRAVFAMYGEHAELARDFIRTLPAAVGPNAEQMNAMTMSFVHRLGELVRRAQGERAVAPDVDPFLAASCVFAIYFMALLAWIRGQVPHEALESTLRAGLDLLVRGLRPPSGSDAVPRGR